MSMGKTMIGGTSRSIQQGKTLVKGTAYQVRQGNTLINGTGYQIGSTGDGTLGSLPIGSLVSLPTSYGDYPFIVVHQGLPSANYDSSCEGTWLLMEEIWDTARWNTGTSYMNDYENSAIHSYLNEELLPELFDANLQSIMKEVRIPYRKGSGSGKTVSAGANGLLTRLFLLSAQEVNLSGTGTENLCHDGDCLDYFSGSGAGADDIRIAMLEGIEEEWWLRSPICTTSSSGKYAAYILTDGDWDYGTCSGFKGARPTLILPSDTPLDGTGGISAISI